MSNITGIGVIGTRNADGRLFLSPATNFTMAEDREVTVVQGHSETDCTPLRDQDAAEKSSQVTVTLETGILDEEAFNRIIWNAPKQTSLSIELPRFHSGIVVGGAIAVPGLTADQANVNVIILDALAPGNLPLTTQPVGTGVTALTAEVGAGSVAVDAVYDGKTAVVYYRQTETNFEMTGGNTTYAPYQNVELFVKICSTRFSPKRIWFPRCTSITGFNFDGSSETFSREFRSFLPPGWQVTYAEFTIQ
ncbi:MAG: hypothetical protein AAFW67_13525 [Cyanobacteria bacterium J06638_38]